MNFKLSDIAAAQGDAIDSRYHPSAAVRRQLNKVFPTHWSFLLGEVALYSFIVLLLSGVYLTLFYDPSMTEVTYAGVYQPLRGIEMSKAYASTLDISFEVRGGLFVRQIHHWAALLTLGSGGSPGTGGFLFADPAEQHEALVEAEHAAERKALTALRERQERNGSSNGHGSNGHGSGPM